MKTTLIFVIFCLISIARAGYSPFGDIHWKAPVDSQADLPASGNLVGDVRVETTDFGEYVWNGSSWVAISGGGGGVTSVTASSPLFSSGGSTPNITCQAASGSQDGCLSSSDWTAFNSKQDALNFSDSLSEAAGTVTLVNDSASPGATQYYGTDGSGVLGYHPVPFPSNSAPPGGSDTDVQYNSSGSFGGDSGFTYDGAGSVTATTFIGNLTGNADTATALASSPSQCSSGNYATGVNSDGSANCSNPNPSPLPAPSPSGDFLCTNGSNWIPCPAPSGGGGGTPGGSDTQVQYNSSGSFAGDSGFTYDGSGNVTASTFIGSLTGNASTASALAALPTSCSGNNWATGIAANGDASCSQIGFSNLSGTASLSSQVTGILPFANGGTNEASPNPSPSPSSFVAWDGNNNVSANNFIAGYATTATAGGTTTLTVDSARQQFFTGTSTQTVVLPVTSTLTTGQQFSVTNNSTTSIAVNSSGGNVVSTIAPNQTIVFTCVSTSGTDASSWNVNNNFGYVAQTTWVGSLSVTGCSSAWSVTGSTAATVGTQTGCTYTASGNISAPSTNTGGFTIQNAAPGEYRVVYTGTAYDNTSANGNAQFFLCSGSNSNCAGSGSPVAWNATGVTVNVISATSSSATGVPLLEWRWKQTTAANLELDVYAATSSTNSAQLFGTTSLPGTFTVYRYPTSSEVAYRPDALPASWSGTQVGSGGGWTTTSTSYADFSAASTSSTLVQITNTNFGSVSAASGLTPAITWTPPIAGLCYTVSASGTSSNALSSTGIGLRLVDSGGTIIDAGSETTEVVNDSPISFRLSGPFVASSASPVTTKIQGLTSNGSDATSIKQSSTLPIMWSISAGCQSINSPFLMGSVTSNSSGQEHIERAQIVLNGSSSSISSQSGSWISFDSYSSPKTTFDITSGEFSGTPSCQCTLQNSAFTATSDGNCACDLISLSSSSMVILPALTGSGGECGPSSNLIANIICMGPH